VFVLLVGYVHENIYLPAIAMRAFSCWFAGVCRAPVAMMYIVLQPLGRSGKECWSIELWMLPVLVLVAVLRNNTNPGFSAICSCW
jgi:hypothetical protein